MDITLRHHLYDRRRSENSEHSSLQFNRPIREFEFKTHVPLSKKEAILYKTIVSDFLRSLGYGSRKWLASSKHINQWNIALLCIHIYACDATLHTWFTSLGQVELLTLHYWNVCLPSSKQCYNKKTSLAPSRSIHLMLWTVIWFDGLKVSRTI